jgi:hypothetical protein
MHEHGQLHPWGRLTVFVSSVTAPVRARSRPSTVAPVVAVMLSWAMTVPTIVEVVPSVAEDPTCQNTLHAVAFPTSWTTLALAVVKAEPTWKMKTALGSPPPSSVSVPVMPNDEFAV